MPSEFEAALVGSPVVCEVDGRMSVGVPVNVGLEARSSCSGVDIGVGVGVVSSPVLLGLEGVGSVSIGIGMRSPETIVVVGMRNDR